MPRPRKLTLNQETEICLYYQSGQTGPKLASMFQVSPSTIEATLKLHGVQSRKHATRNLRHTCDHSFFCYIDTEEKAYWLGYLSADGCISKSNVPREGPMLVINLSAIDKEHLVKLKTALQSSHPIKDYTLNYKTPNQKISRFTISSKQLTDDLIKHGVHPRKTFTLQWPQFLPDNLLPHFTRGFFDGDGCFYIYIKSRRSPSAHFSVTANFVFLQEMQRYLVPKCALTATKLSPQRNSFCLSYGGNLQVARIAHLLYDGATVFLERKYNKIKHLL